MSLGYDKYSINHNLLLAMTFEEMTGVDGDPTYDRAKPHHLMTLTDTGAGALTWGAAASGFPYLNFAPGAVVADYVWVECLAAAAVDLRFTTQDFTLLAWVYLDNLAAVHTIMCLGAQAILNGGGYQLTVSFATPASLFFATCQGATVQSTFSEAVINAGEWCLLGATRQGTVGLTYINGHDRTDGPQNHIDPDTQIEPFHIGFRQIETTGVGIDYDTSFEGYLAYPRVWGSRCLTPSEMLAIWLYERHWFGV